LELGQSLSSPIPGESGGGLYDAIHAGGYDRRANPSAVVPFLATGSIDGGDYGDAVRVDRPAAPLGADSRFLYPSLPFVGVDSDVTSVSTFRQKSRGLPSLSAMVRTIAAVSAKPETNTVAEVVDEPLHQIATVSTETPNIMLESAAFRSWINFDLQFAYSSAVDWHVLNQISTASPTPSAAGLDFLESIMLAAEDVASAGYSPNVLAASPGSLIELALAKQPGTDDYVFSGNQLDIGLRKVAVRGLVQPLVMDASAVGVLYNSPIRFATFEENNGTTNPSTVRIESNGVFVVQRIDAAAEVAVSS
jgi:hypothetical protein